MTALILLCTLAMLGLMGYLISVENTKKAKDKARQLAEDKKKLESQTEKMSIELLARRNQLPWIDVEEFDGPQE